MKLLFLIDNVYRGGKERRMIELLKGLLQAGGFEPELAILSDNVQYPEIYDLGIPVHKLIRKTKRDPFHFLRLYRLCKNVQPDLIHSWGAMANIYVIPAAKRLGIKLVNACIADAPARFTYSDKKHIWTKLSFPFSDVIVGNSQAGLNAYGTPPAKSKRVHNGFDFKRVQALEPVQVVQERWTISPGPVIGMVGAFYDRKDFETFIQAAIQLLASGRQVTFLAIGDGPNLEKCRRLVPPQYQDRIRLPGLIQGVESVIQLFDIGILSTNAQVHGEGISNSIMEYMALGKPVVASAGGGTAEILQDGKTGFLVAPQAPLELVERIAYLLDHPDQARQMGECGRLRVNTHFSLDYMTRQYIDLYRKLWN